MASEFGEDVLVTDVLLVDALVIERRLALALVVERFALVFVMTGLLKSRRAPEGAPSGKVDGS
jgi:hypothetical protein